MVSGFGFSKFVGTGNEADLHLEDYLEYLAQDEDTRVLTAYIEGLREGRRFFRLAREITRRKPMVVIKAGGTGGSARAARSHTGTLVGSDEIYTAAFRQSGVIRVEDDDELCDTVTALLSQPLPGGNRVGILTLGGGPGVVAAEACEKEGLGIAQLSPTTIEKLNGYLPSRWSHGNPVDTAGMTAAHRKFVFSSLWAMMEDENIDAILFQIPLVLSAERLSAILNLSPEKTRDFQEFQKERLSMAVQRAKEYGKPLLLVTRFEAASLLRKEGIPAYHNPRHAARVLHHLVWYKHYLDALDR